MGIWDNIARAVRDGVEPEPVILTSEMEVVPPIQDKGAPQGSKYSRVELECDKEDVRGGKRPVTGIYRCLAPRCRRYLTLKGTITCPGECVALARAHYTKIIEILDTPRVARTSEEVRALNDKKKAPVMK